MHTNRALNANSLPASAAGCGVRGSLMLVLGLLIRRQPGMEN
jgi:hypothetical protein